MTTITTRKVTDTHGREHEVHAWYLVRNGWEYWQLEAADENGYAYGYVMGDACEFGGFDVNEVSDFLMSQASGELLYDLAPPSDYSHNEWEWKKDI